jgi:phosphatidylinositol glycan class B
VSIPDAQEPVAMRPGSLAYWVTDATQWALQRHSLRTLFIAASIVRVVSALWNCTYAAPDEHWQAPEIAHRIVYGVGYTTWEWWPSYELRGALHPVLLAAVQWLTWPLQLALPAWTHRFVIAFAPRLFHAMVATATDVALYDLVLRVAKHDAPIALAHAAASFTVVLNATSWFQFYAASRMFTNNLETMLLVVGLGFWYRGVLPSPGKFVGSPGAFTAAAICAGLGASLRPTAIVPWIFAALALLVRKGWGFSMDVALRRVVPGAFIGLSIGCLCDFWLYGHASMPLVNFIQFNVIDKLDRLYGSYPLLWYAYDGIPATMVGCLPFFFVGIFLIRATDIRFDFMVISGGYIALLSAGAHKEHRFLLPVMPLLHFVAGNAIAEMLLANNLRETHNAMDNAIVPPASTLFSRAFATPIPATPVRRRRSITREERATPETQSISKSHELLRSLLAPWPMRPIIWASITGICVLHAGLAVYFGRWHQAAPISAVNAIASEAATIASYHVGRTPRPLTSLMNVHFLMPCHSTPFYASVHENIHMVALDCSPPFRQGLFYQFHNITGGHGAFPSESDAWSMEPLPLLRALYGPKPALPDVCSLAASDLHTITPRAPHLQFRPLNLSMGASAAAFAVDPAAMLNEFGTVITAYQLGRPKYSKLPTHILLFDTDVAKSSVSEFIARHLYIKQATFFHAHVATDVHASSDPGYMLLYVHPCWLSLMAAL